MKDVWIYVEGGGGKDSKDQLRQAFGQFLTGPRVIAREQGVRWRVVLCGSREQTYQKFRDRLRNQPDAGPVFLLVDADRPVDSTPREHLAAGETRWDLSFATDGQCHLMVEVMESWFLADQATLFAFYGRDFAPGQIPNRTNVEEIPKSHVYASLDRATRNTRKGKYDKADHAPQILKDLDPDRVRARAPHCDRLFEALLEAVA
ncbi:MAG TPA: DUF4276 family protein [Longimicrobium sp.]